MTCPGTFCEPARTVPLPSTSEWAFDLSLVQDANTTAGLLQFLFENDGVEGWVYVSTGATDAIPKFLGHVYLGAAAIGGAPATPLIADVSFRCIDKPIVAFGPTPGGLFTVGATARRCRDGRRVGLRLWPWIVSRRASAMCPATATLAAVKAIKRVAEIEACESRPAAIGVSPGFGRRGQLTTRDDYDFDAASAEATVYAVPPGMWALVSYGAAPHVIGFGRSQRRTGNYIEGPSQRRETPPPARHRIRGGGWGPCSTPAPPARTRGRR